MASPKDGARDPMSEMKLHRNFQFTPEALDGFTELSYTFAHAIKPETSDAALTWFGGETVGAANYVKHLKKNFNIPTWAESAKVSSTLMGTEKVFKESTQISWSDSEFAAQFAQVLDDFGGRLVHLNSPKGPNIEVLVRFHALSNGTFFVMIGEAWKKNESEEVFIYWHINALNHTRHFQLKPHPSFQFFIPHLLQSAAFLSESSDPDYQSTLIPRDAIFGCTESVSAPEIALHLERDHLNVAILINEEDIAEFHFMWSAETVRYGYIFNEVSDISEIEIQIAVASTSLAKVAEILVDGYSNHQSPGITNFQEITFSDETIYKEGALDHFARGRYLAGPISQFIDLEGYFLHHKIDVLQGEALAKKDPTSFRLALNGYQEIISNGSGISLAYALNRYVYAMLHSGGPVLGLSESERAGFYDYGARLLTYATTLRVDLEDANAFSNLAVLEVARSRFNDALAAANAGITLLKEDRSYIPESFLGDSDPQLNPHIKLELFATRAELLYRAGQVAKAKDLAGKVLAEANSKEYEGAEIEKVKWILSH
jgi:hypothetical protein